MALGPVMSLSHSFRLNELTDEDTNLFHSSSIARTKVNDTLLHKCNKHVYSVVKVLSA